MAQEENEDIFYSLEDSEKDPDQSPYNYALSPDNDETREEEGEETVSKKISPWKLLFGVMFNPVEGWKRIRRQKIAAEGIQAGCFYPLLALLALSKFSDYFYSVNVSLKMVISQSVVAFVSYFFGYFTILFLLSILLPKSVSDNFDKDFGKSYILIGLSTLVLFSFITNLLPMLWPVLIFLPLWTLYLLYQGSRFFKLAEPQVLKFLVVVGCSVVGVPIFIDWGLNELMPY